MAHYFGIRPWEMQLLTPREFEEIELELVAIREEQRKNQ